MQPENTRAPSGPEQVPVTTTPQGERIPVLPTPESGIEAPLERVEQAADSRATAADIAATAAPASQPAQPAGGSPTAQPATSGPLVAADEDVIEKEWVDKAKKIIHETKDDPHGRTERVNELQRDYLKKRYNKELETSE
jgi:hypothetical protein